MYYTLEEAANVLSLTPGDVNRLREQGALRGFKDGATWKFDKDAINKYLAEKIKKESALLSAEGDEEGPTMLAADSADFDAMFDQAADNAGSIVAKDDEFSLAKDDDELALAPEEGDLDLVLAEEPKEKSDVVDELTLAPEEGNDDLLLVSEDEPLTLSDEASALVEDEPAVVESSSAVDLAGETNASDDDLLHLGSDSGLSLLDDVDVGGSNISLGDEEGELVLGGSGSGSGSGLNLGSDSGLELLGDSDGDFSLGDDVAVAAEESAEDDGIFELAPEAEETPVLNLGKEADADAPTELAAADEGIFELAEDVNQVSGDDSSSDSNSASQLIDIDDSATNPFLTEVDDSSSTSMDAFTTSDSDSNSDVFKIEDSDSSDSPFGAFGADASSSSSPFGVDDSSSSSPFGAAPDMPSDSTSSDGLSFDKSGSSDSFGASDFGAADVSEPVASVSHAPVASTNYTGKDLIFLVPCLIFLILATIGAYELCRTIWSYQEGSFDLTGPVLETIAKMVKLI